jgi:FkbM family methyltransferase
MIVGYEDYKHKYDFSDVRGVIHVGAHHGQEYWEYIQSFGNISTHWFEPLPSAFEVLSQRLQQQPNCHLYHCALGASNDEVSIWEDSGNDGQSSSLMKPKEHLSQWSHITFDSTRNVQMRTLDSFGITGSNVLVMDAQGYELEVLKGAVETLKMVDHVFCEINSIEMYEGCPTPDEIDAFLVSHGFVMREQWWTDDKWGDGYWYRPASRSFITEYFPDELRIRIWNQTDEFISLDFKVLYLDTDLCFYQGWATAPVDNYTDIHLPEDYKLEINKLGIRVMLFEKGYLQLMHIDDHYAVDGVSEKYTQYEEEGVILEYFKDRDPAELAFLDIGANDGISFSNSRRIAIDGWSGVCLEPSPAAYSKLLAIYADSDRVYPVNYGISDVAGEFGFHQSGNWEGRDDTPVSILGTLDPEQKNRFEGMTWSVIKCNFVTFSEFLNDSPIQKFDFISIDVEGHDWMVLKQIDLRSLGCQMICMEHNSESYRLGLYEGYCQAYGMTEIYRNEDNVIYAIVG